MSLEQVAKDNHTDLDNLYQMVCDGLRGVSIPHFSDGQLEIIKAALEVAGDL